MKKTLISLSCLALTTIASAQLIPNKQLQISGSPFVYFHDTKIDALGNIYTVGYADANSDINPGPGISNSGSVPSTFVSKYNPTTQTLNWVVTYTASTNITSFTSLKSMALNSLNEVYVSGLFNNTTDIDPGVGSAFVASIQAPVLIKFDNNGNYQGYKQIPADNGGSTEVAIDKNNNVYLCGFTQGITNFDSGVTNYTVSTNASSIDLFIMKYTPSLNFSWATIFGSSAHETSNAANQIKFDGAGNVYVTAKLASGAPSVTIASTNLLANAEFILKLNNAGSITNCWKFDITASIGNKSLRLNVFNNGKFYVSGEYYGNVDFDPTAAVLTKTNTTVGGDQFVGLYDSNANPLWLHTFNNYIGEVIYANVVDNSKNIFICGNYDSANDYDKSTGIFTFPNTSPIPQSMIVSYDSLGMIRGGRTFMNGTDINFNSRLLMLPNDNGILFMGRANTGVTSIDYAPGPPTMNMSVSQYNGVITTYDFCLSSLQSTVTPSICSGSTYTLPTGSTVTATGTYTSSLKSYWGCDSIIFTNLTVNPLPTITASTNNTLICVGQSANISASGATSYTWNTTATSPSITVSPTINTTYSVNGTNANGCKNSATIVQNVSACTNIFSLSGSDNTKDEAQISIYPNPTENILHIRTEHITETTTVEIINMLGEVMIQSKLLSNDTVFNTQTLANGVYFLSVKQGNNYQQVKFIKQ